jgi:hypothetical protein
MSGVNKPTSTADVMRNIIAIKLTLVIRSLNMKKARIRTKTVLQATIAAQSPPFNPAEIAPLKEIT